MEPHCQEHGTGLPKAAGSPSLSQTGCAYGWGDPGPNCSHTYLLPAVLDITHRIAAGKSLAILDMGCGNGYVACQLAGNGHSVVAIDASYDGIEIARSSYSNIRFETCSIYDADLMKLIAEPVDCVVSLEVIEHLFYPKRLFEQGYSILKPGGFLIVSTPYHGYVKNLALSLVNGWDRHFKVEWDGGHIKFFSKRTLGQMARAAGFENVRFRGVGRIPGLWKSMIMVADKR